MIRRPVFAANWKMNHGPSETLAFMAAFLGKYGPKSDRMVAMFLPALSIAAARAALAGRNDIQLGVQNIHTEPKGAFTGENSAPMAKDAGATLVLVGHSERRHVFGESDDQTAKKCSIALQHQLTPVLCIGEKIDQREKGETAATVLRQLRAGVAALDQTQIGAILIAYEPVWAIGTGRTATPADAAEVHAVIRKELGALCGSPQAAANVPILYGGSVTRENAASLLAAPEVSGLLVGGASLDPSSWSTIVST